MCLRRTINGDLGPLLPALISQRVVGLFVHWRALQLNAFNLSFLSRIRNKSICAVSVHQQALLLNIPFPLH